MALKNRLKMLEIVKGDCEIQERYYLVDADGRERTCAIGGLLKETGFDMEYFSEETYPDGEDEDPYLDYDDSRANNTFIQHFDEEDPMSPMGHLADYFGLTPEQAHEIQSINDHQYDRDERIAEIVAFIEGLD